MNIQKLYSKKTMTEPLVAGLSTWPLIRVKAKRIKYLFKGLGYVVVTALVNAFAKAFEELFDFLHFLYHFKGGHHMKVLRAHGWLT
jgi:hypothetical protein